MKIAILDNIREKYKTHPLLINAILAFSFFCSFLINAPFLNIILDLKPKITDFSNHIISNAALHNFDVSSRVRLYYFVFSSLFFITCFVFLGIFQLIRKRFNDSSLEENTLIKIQQISFIGIASVLAGIFFIEVDLSVLFIVFLGFYYFFFSNKKNKNTFHNGLWILIAAIPFSFLTFRILKSNKIVEKLPENLFFQDTVLPFSIELVFFFFFFFLFAITLHFFLKKFFSKKSDNSDDLTQRDRRFYLATIPLSMIIIVLSIFLEIFNIINLKTGFVFKNPNLLFFVLTLFAIAIAIIYFKFLSKNELKNIDYDPIEKYHFPLLIVSLAFMISQPWRMYGPENEFFEFANHGLSVDHFFRYGSIPIVETFDAHMLSNQLFAYVYGLINGYEPWAPFLYGSYILIFIYLLVFVLLKRIIGGFYAFIILLCFPMLSILISSFVYSGIVALLLLSLINKKCTKQFYWFWASIVLLCLFRLDLGFASAMAGIVSYFIIHFITQKEYHLKTFLKTGVISVAFTVFVFVILCLFKGVNPFNRLLELLSIAMSNQNWAYENMGDSNHVLFRLSYYILPILTLFLLVKTILRAVVVRAYFSKITESKSQLAALIFFIFFSLVFYFNIPRGIVRHHFLFNNVVLITSTIPFALLSYIYILKRKNNLVKLLSILIITFFVINLTTLSFQNKSKSIFKEAFVSAPFNEKFQTAYGFPKSRMSETFSLAEIKYFKEILDKLLLPDETYFDFSSTNYYHALVERKNPLYVNQSPLLLNGDKSQDFALGQLKKTKIPIVLMPNKENIWHQIDGIPVEHKYYKISEFIYQRYSPFLKMKDFTIYVDNLKKESFEQKLKTGSNKKYTISDFSKIDLAQIQKNDILVQTNQSNNLILTKNGVDAFIFGLYKSNLSSDTIVQNTPKTISIKIDASASGSIQLYYWLNGEDYFSEANSKVFQIPSEGSYEFELNTPSAVHDVRIDVDTPKIILKEFVLKNKDLESGFDNQVLNYNLGEIPMVWGELADQKLFKSVNNLGEELIQSNVVLQFQLKEKKPYYLFFEMDSDTIQAATASLFDANNNKKVDYLIRVNKGKNNYAIRLSSNVHWWKEIISKVSLTTEKTVKITKFAIISEDGKDQFSLKENDFYLSNITDENWIGGVGIPFNLLLMNNSPRTLSFLQKHKKIELKNGSIINIEKHWVSGNFIHVEIKETLKENKEQIRYPNDFKFIK